MAELERGFVSLGGSPWLIYGFERLPSLSDPVFAIEAYLPADVTTPEVRRGSVLNASRQSGQIISINAPNAERGGRYAQVAVPGRGFDAIQGDRDINLPFLLIGAIDDADLVRIVTLVRSSPALPPPYGRAPGHWPIRSVTRRADDSVDVHQLSVDRGRGQGMTISRQTSGWVVTRAFEFVN